MTVSGFSGADRDSIYAGRATNWASAVVFAVVFNAVVLLPLLVVGGESDGSWWDLPAPTLIFIVGLALYALAGSSVRTTVGLDGVSIHFGALGWPRGTYRLDEIERAELVNLHYVSVVFGFWWTPRRTCCAVHSGLTLRLWLSNGRTVTVTTPDPYAAVTAINDAKDQPGVSS